MENTLPFETFLSTLRATNRDLGFFVDWQKCLANKDKLSISLNHLNLLLGVPKDSLQDKITLLFNEYAKAFDVLPLILAIRNETPINAYLQNPKGIYDFICESGLDSIFSDRKIKDLNDFVFGSKKEFIVAAFDGFCFDNNDTQKENLQILDFIYANNINEAREIAAHNSYGAYEQLVCYEIAR